MKKDKNKTILLVEDEALIAKAEKIKIEKLGYNVITEKTGENAIEICNKNAEINLVLMDINLGDGIDGTEAAVKILKDRDIPIVFLTCHSDSEIVEKTEKITSYGYVIKNSGIAVIDASIKMAFKLFEAKLEIKANEKALQDSKNKISSLFNNAQVGLFRSSITNGNLLECNDLFFKMTGYESRESCIAEYNASERYVDREERDSMLSKMQMNGAIQNYEVQLTQKNGSPIWVSFSGRLYPDKDYLEGVLVDITRGKLREAALIEKDKRYNSILESSTNGIVFTDRDGNFIDCNDSYLKMLGYSLEELKTKNIYDLTPEKWHKFEKEIVAPQLLSMGSIGTIEKEYIHKNGAVFPIELNIQKYDEKLFYAVVKDISKQKIHGLEINSPPENISAGLVVYTGDGLVQQCNQEALNILGLTMEQLSGINPIDPQWSFVHEDLTIMKELDYPLNKIITTKQSLNDYIAGINHPDKNAITWVNVHAIPLYSKDNKLEQIIVNYVDITEVRRLEKKSKNDEESLRITLNSIGDAIIATDIEGRITRMNPVAEILTGCSLHNAFGRDLSAVFNVVNSDTGKVIRNQVRNVLENGKIVGLANNTILIDRDGREYNISETAAPIVDSDGFTTGVVLVFRDVTDEYRIQNQYRMLFDNSISGISINEIILDESGTPVDYVFLHVNKSFETFTGLKGSAILGQKVTEVLPGIEKSSFIDIFGKVVLTGESITFQKYSEELGRDYSIRAYKLAPGQFVTAFTEVT